MTLQDRREAGQTHGRPADALERSSPSSWGTANLRCIDDLMTIPEKMHLVEESRILDAVADVATNWFHRHLA